MSMNNKVPEGKGAAAPQQLLDPVEPPLAVRSEYLRDYPTVLVMKQKLFQVSEDDYIVTDTNGDDVLRVTAKAMSFTNKNLISSMDHVPLYSVRRRPFSFGVKTEVEDAEGTLICSVNEQLSWGSKLHCTAPTKHGPVHLTVHGKVWRYAADIKLDDGTTVATISRECFDGAGQWAKNRQTYFVTVAPGVDLSLMVILCIAFDGLKRVEASRHSN